MSCDSNSNILARAACRVGISRLPGKYAYAAGLIAGAAGLLATVGIVAPRLLKGVVRRDQPAASPPLDIVDVRRLPSLSARAQVPPAQPAALKDKTCANCAALPAAKPGAWYVIDDKAHCQDCAPRAAQAAGVDLVVPRQPPPSTSPASARGMNLEAVTQSLPRWFAEAARNVRLEMRPVEIKTAWGDWVRLASDAYFVYRREGSSGTGLAITPLLRRDSQGNVTTDTRQWNVTHLNSGKVVGGPFDSLDEAHGLAGALAAFTDWRRSDDKFSQAEIREARQIIQDYRGILENARARAGDRALGGVTMQPAELFRPR
jgi:hypothetical protein